MNRSHDNTQSAAERRSAEAQVRELVARVAPAQQRLTATMRRWLRKRLPAAHEIVYEYSNWLVISYSPNERGYEGILGMRVSPGGLALYFNRARELADPDKLLQGSGKQARSVPVPAASTLDRPAVKHLVDEAIARSPMPGATSGRGPLVIRSAKAKGKKHPSTATPRSRKSRLQ